MRLKKGPTDCNRSAPQYFSIRRDYGFLIVETVEL